MPYTTIVAGTTITASWANANVRDQTIAPFASASARDSAITSPVEGQHCYLTDTDRTMVYNGAAWVPADSNIVARQNLTGSSSVFTTDATSDFTLTGVAVRVERLYEVTLHSQWSLSGAPSTWNINFHVDGTLTEKMGIAEASPVNGYVSASILWLPTTGTKNLDIRLDETGGTGDFQFVGTGGANSRWFYVEDIGPR